MSALPTTTEADERLEREIQRECALCLDAQYKGERESAQQHWRAMVRLIGQRSPRQVAKMERERNLV